ncbi:MAG TPA: thiamine pyrophosphate-dependent dehydrogenase E1 component subunit alpha [Burkholderiales bacterium]|nr:thiamine pyrophosphate-dependent dehydrogenase E1 component subunit alpha [Burkholderiales bacterium]
MTSTTPDPIDVLRKMILIREFDELAIKLRTAGKIYGAVHPYVGEEAIAVGVCANLTNADRVTSTHRGHGHCIAKGADVRRMMAELFGRVDGYCKGKGGSMHIADFSVGMLGANGIVGGGLPMATGAALAAQLERKGNVAVCFFGDGAVAEGEFHEALNISSVWRLPVVFVCENNQYAANNAVAVQHRITDVAVHAGSYGLPGVTIDGNDVMAVYEAARAAIDRARRGEGPTLVECKSYRWHFHAMRNAPPPETRPAAEIAAWKQRDPIARLAADLIAQRLLTESELGSLQRQVHADLQEAVAFAEASPFPDPSDILVDMFAASS